MAVERLEFEGPEAAYHAYHAAQHVVRYAAVRALVKGKRVLDVACGAGYGARLLSDWGAAEVVGVDVAPAAVATAKRMFNGTGRTFLTGDAERLEDILDGTEPFDVIVSFETIEHLAHPHRLLEALSKLRKADSVIAISCPNDKIYQTDKGGNPFHLNNFTFDEFKALCEQHLGPATQWLLGAPVQGEINFVAGDTSVEQGHSDALAIAAPEAIGGVLLLPSQSTLEVAAENCSHYLGIWGASVGPNTVVSAQSVPSYREPWLALDWLKARVADLEGTKANYYEPEIARLNAAIADYEKTKREWFEPELERLARAVEQVTTSLARSEQEADAVRTRIASHYEPEIARLQTLVAQGHSKRQALLSEIQDQRARVLYYIDQVSMLAAQIDPLRARTDELERLKREWFDPEFNRMHSAIEQYEKTKLEWFEPQLRQQQARLAELEARLVTMAQFEGSRSYRAWRRFQKLYHVPVVGPVLRATRRVVAAAVRKK